MKTKGIIQLLVALGLGYTGYAIYKRIKKKDEEELNSFDGGEPFVLAENNYPYGQYFHDRKSISVESLPFYGRNKGTYKS